MTVQETPVLTDELPTAVGWPRRHVLKAGAVAVGAGLLGRFAQAADSPALSQADYVQMDAWRMAQAVRQGEVSPQALLAAAMARCDAVNPRVKAVNLRHDDYAQALLKAREASVGNVVSRNVRDMALFLDAGQGHEAGSPYWTKPLARPYVDELQVAPGRLRVGLVRESLTGAPLDPEVARVLDATAQRLSALGHDVEPVRLQVDPRQLFGAHGAVIGDALLTLVRDREQALGRSATPEDLERITQVVLGNAQKVTGEALYRARQSFESIGGYMEDQFRQLDVILSPVTANVTPKLGLLSLDQPWDSYAHNAMGSAGFTVLANVSGQPAISLPVGMSDTGMPIGMMLTAPMGGEDVLLRLSAQLEQAHPWAKLPTL